MRTLLACGQAARLEAGSEGTAGRRNRSGAAVGLGIWIACMMLLTGCGADEPRYPAQLTPEEALEHFQISDDFRIEVFATEPLVVDPVWMAFDEQGRAYVVEMRDYPNMPEPGEGRSRIRLVEDTDGDGRADRAVIFADSIGDATSVLPWKGGLLVTAAPDILYLKDTDGDDVADVKEVLFTGFFTGNSEAQITNLRFAIDNWIYAANTGNPGEVTYTAQPEAAPVSMRGSDFRFRLDRGLFGTAAGYAQFGQDLDDWGNRFVTQNTIHVRHIVLPEPYLSRNPHLPSSVARAEISDHDLTMFQETPPPYWRAVRTERRNERYQAEGLDRVEYAEDHFTGSSGGTVYAGDLFPEAYYGNLFTGDVAGNLVHRDILRPQGATFVASRAEDEQDREFLSSTDSWFRPASLANGPDGALYLLDMYRQHIETPLSIEEDLKADMDFFAGDTLGRIYRIVPAAAPARPAAQPRLGEASTAQLVEALSHPNRWWRLTAQRLLLERQDRAAIAPLRALIARSDFAQARLHAYYALEGLSALDAELLRGMLRDPHPRVREHAVRLSEAYPQLLPVTLGMVEDADPRVVFQTALTLGGVRDPRARKALARVAAAHGQDAWFRMAVLSSEQGSSVELLEDLAREHRFFAAPDSGRAKFLQEIAAVIGARNQSGEVTRLLALLSDSAALQVEPWQVAGLSGLARGLGKVEGARLTPAAQTLLDRLRTSTSAPVQSAAGEVAEQLNKQKS